MKVWKLIELRGAQSLNFIFTVFIFYAGDLLLNDPNIPLRSFDMYWKSKFLETGFVMWSCRINVFVVGKHLFRPEVNYMEHSPCQVKSFSDGQEINRILCNYSFNYCVNKSQPLVQVLSDIKIIHVLPSYFLKNRFNIILPSKPQISNYSLILRFPHQIPLYAPLLSSIRATHPANRNFLIWSPE